MKKELLVAGMALMFALPAVAAGSVGDAELRVVAFTGSPSQAEIGSEFSVSATVRNSGRRRARSSRVAYYLSASGARSRDDIRLDPRATVRALVPGARVTLKSTLQIPATAKLRRYVLLACADDTRFVREQSEQNNCRAAARRIRTVAASAMAPASVPDAAAVPIPGPVPAETGPPPPPAGSPPPPPPPAGPAAVAGSASLAEDTPATIVLRGTDADTCQLTFEVTAEPAHGTLGTPDGEQCASGSDRATLTYTPDAHFHGADELRFTVSDGSVTSPQATVAIAVAAINDAPVNALPASLPQVVMNTTLQVTGLAVSDVDATAASPFVVTLTAGHGSVTPGPAMDVVCTGPEHEKTCSGPLGQINSTLAGTEFNPSPGYSGPASLTISSSDGGASGPGGAQADSDELPIMVTRPPLLSTMPGALDYVEDDPATPIDSGLSLSDADSANLVGARVALTAGYRSGEDVLALSSPPAGITASFDAATGALTLSGTASTIIYRTALQSVTYRNTSNAPNATARTATFTANDATAAGAATRTIEVTPANDAPTAAPDYGGIVEDGVLYVGMIPGLLTNDDDPDPGDTLTVSRLNGSQTLIGTSAKGATVTLYADGRFRYDPGALFLGLNSGEQTTDTFTYTARDGAAADSPPATVTITITGRDG